MADDAAMNEPAAREATSAAVHAAVPPPPPDVSAGDTSVAAAGASAETEATRILRETGHKFDESGRLRTLEGGDFKYTDEPTYRTVGSAVLLHIEEQMRAAGLRPVKMGVADADAESGTVSVFEEGTPGVGVAVWVSTPEVMASTERLMVLLQGSGAVRPGMWARKLCINDSLKEGSMLSFIAAAQAEGYAVVIPNPNLHIDESRDGVDVPGSTTNREHMINVWDLIVAPSAAKHIAMVAHSAGGDGVCTLARYRLDALKARVFAVAFTDAVHTVDNADTEDTRFWLRDNVIDWEASREPVDTPMPLMRAAYGDLIPSRSAGHPKHEWTTASAEDSILKWFASRVPDRAGDAGDDGDAAGAVADEETGATAGAGAEDASADAGAARSAGAGADGDAGADTGGEGDAGAASSADPDAGADASADAGAGADASAASRGGDSSTGAAAGSPTSAEL